MSDLIIKGAGGIKDGLYVIKDGEMFKYKPNGGTVRSYHVTERKKGRWIPWRFHNGFRCGICDEPVYDKHNFCPDCGADMRSE